MKDDLKELLELVIELLSNQNAAGEYDGNDPRLMNTLYDEKVVKLARKVQKEYEINSDIS